MTATASMQAVLDLARALSTVTALEELAAVVSDLARQVLSADFAAVAVLDAGGEHLAYLDLESYLRDEDVAHRWQQISTAHPSPPASAVRTAGPVVFQTLAESVAAHPLVLEDLTRTGFETTANVPLVGEESVLGLLGVAWDAPGQCSPGRLQLVQALAALTAQTVARLRLVDQRTRDAQQMAALVEVAAALGAVDTEAEVLGVLTTHGIAALGAQGAGLCLLAPDRATVHLLTSAYFEADLSDELQTLPVDYPLPVVHAAVSGTPYFLDDRAAAVALYPGAHDLYARARTQASAEVPLRSGGVLLGSLSLAFAEARTWRAQEQALVEALAAMTAQALQRLRSRGDERAAAAEVRRLSEGLQRSLLTDLPEPDHLELVARYVPAIDQAQVGGDWYDAFLVRDGSTFLVVGDVTGHDSAAAVSMAQIRNVLRGIAHAVPAPPAGVLASLDQAMRDLAVGALATAVLARVEQGPAEAAAGLRTLRWSNAGHLPPLLLRPDGTGEFLTRRSDLLLGLVPDAARQDHTCALDPGATVLLYTDGLVERRGENLDQGLQRLLQTAVRLARLPLQQLCDELVEALAGRTDDDHDDDVALLAVRAHPQD